MPSTVMEDAHAPRSGGEDLNAKSLYGTRSKDSVKEAKEAPRRLISGRDPFGEPIYKGWSIPKLPDGPGGIKGLGKSVIKSDIREIRETLEDDMLEDDNSLGFMCKTQYSKSLVQEKKQKAAVPTPTPKGGRGKGKSKSPASRLAGIGAESSAGTRFVSSTAIAFNQPRSYGSTGTTYNVASNNFYYPFKKMKEWEELKDYLEFVNQQAFNSMRNACVEKIEVLRVQRDNDLRALKAIEETHLEQVRCSANAREILESSRGLMQAVLGCLAMSQESVTLLRKENDALRERLARLESAAGSADLNGVPGKRGRGRTNSKQRKVSDSGSSLPPVPVADLSKAKMGVLQLPSKGEEDMADDEDDELASAINATRNMRYVNTCYGPGVVHGVRASRQRGYSLVVKLEWGATAFLQLDTLTVASLRTAAGVDGHSAEGGDTAETPQAGTNGQTKSPKKKTKKKRRTDQLLHDELMQAEDQEEDNGPSFQKAAFDALAHMEEDVENEYSTRDRPVLFTRTDNGPPRGVKLDVSIVSSDPSFALPSASADSLEPELLRALYKSNNVLLLGGIADDYQASGGSQALAEREEESNADFDLQSLRRDDRLSKLKFNWAGPDSTPFMSEINRLDQDHAGSERARCGLRRQDLAAWEVERRKNAKFGGDFVRLQSEVAKLRRDVRHRDKRLVESQRTHENLLVRADQARAEAALWKQKCMEVVKIDSGDLSAIRLARNDLLELHQKNSSNGKGAGSASNSVSGSVKSSAKIGISTTRSRRGVDLLTKDKQSSDSGSTTGDDTGGEREDEGEDEEEEEEGANGAIEADNQSRASKGSARNSRKRKAVDTRGKEEDGSTEAERDAAGGLDERDSQKKRRTSTTSSARPTRGAKRQPPSPEPRGRLSSRRR